MSDTVFSKGVQFARQKSRQYLAQSLGSIPGLPAKAGQLFLNRLADTAPVEVASSLGLEEVRQILDREVPHFSQQIDSIDPHGMTASLGQVHRVRLKGGCDLAVKVQYPGVEDSLSSQLDLLLGVFKAFSKGSSFGMDADAYDTFLRQYFSEELDYEKELDHQQSFFEGVSKGQLSDSVIVPRLYPEFSTRKILVQSYEGSIGLRELIRQDLISRERGARCLVRAFLSLLFRGGLVHGDLHEKNWGYRVETSQIVLYDFGAVLRLDRHIVESLKRLTEAAASGGDVYSELIELGFDPEKLQVIRKQLNAVCIAVFEPLLVDGDWDPARWDLREKLAQILGPNRWAFRSAGPPWFLVLMKTVFSLHQSLVLLRVRVPMRALLAEWVSLPQVSLVLEEVDSATESGGGASHLYVRVSEGSREVVSLEFPVRAVESLEYLMSDEVRARVEAEGFDLVQIRKKAHAEGYPRGVLFEMNHQKRTYRVALG